MAKVSARAAARRQIRDILDGTADPDGRGLLQRGSEYEPRRRADYDPQLPELLLRLARLAEAVADTVRDHPDPGVRRSAAVLAARAHPLRAAFHD